MKQINDFKINDKYLIISEFYILFNFNCYSYKYDSVKIENLIHKIKEWENITFEEINQIKTYELLQIFLNIEYIILR